MNNLKNIQDINKDTTYFEFKGYEVRLEMSEDYDNGDLTIRVVRLSRLGHDWEHKFTVVDEEGSKQ